MWNNYNNVVRERAGSVPRLEPHPWGDQHSPGSWQPPRPLPMDHHGPSWTSRTRWDHMCFCRDSRDAGLVSLIDVDEAMPGSIRHLLAWWVESSRKVWNGCFWTLNNPIGRVCDQGCFLLRRVLMNNKLITFVVRWCLWYPVIYPLFDSDLMTWWLDGCECTSRLVVYSWSSFYALESKAALVEELTHKDHLVTRNPTGSLLQA